MSEIRSSDSQKIGVIPARKGSRGLPGKNLRLLAGRELIVHTVEAALQSSLDRVVVTTDCEHIASAARSAGAETPFLRPVGLADDSASSTDVVLHCLSEIEALATDVLCLLQPTSPLRTTVDIDSALEIHANTQHAVVSVVASGKPIEWAYHAEPSTSVLQKVVDSNAPRRQDSPNVVYPNGAIYIRGVGSFVDSPTFFPKTTIGYVMPRERSVDIDDLLDFRWAEFLMTEGLGEA